MAAEETDAEFLLQEISPDESELPESLILYWAAWQNLRYDRQYGMEGWQSPIPFVSIDVYARRYAIEGEEFDVLLRLVQAMDDEWLKYSEETRKERDAQRGN